MPRRRALREGGRAARGDRAGAALGAGALHLAIAWLAFGLQPRPAPPPAADAVIQVDFLPAAAPPVPVEVRHAPDPVPEARRTPAPVAPPERRPDPVPQPVAVPADPLPPLSDAGLPASVPPAVSALASPGPPAPQDLQAAAPSSPPAPAAATLAGRVDTRWEARVMARLASYRRYPVAARARGEEGVAIVRLRMDRAGRVLSAVLARSSGSPRLDAAAIETFHRAAPLPSVPDDLPAPVEIAVPVEFFMH
ncbi:energy transducer TonB [Luteimonas sp. FCS-9]|uniref:energy transducer TonB n=1 Tax=Luteimonas sp. FCS-9 TaxID=1547516 RepID=UPI0012E06540|nr:energy transducer TonB [Luteimonas sp. FCS-9]